MHDSVTTQGHVCVFMLRMRGSKVSTYSNSSSNSSSSTSFLPLSLLLHLLLFLLLLFPSYTQPPPPRTFSSYIAVRNGRVACTWNISRHSPDPPLCPLLPPAPQTPVPMSPHCSRPRQPIERTCTGRPCYQTEGMRNVIYYS